MNAAEVSKFANIPPFLHILKPINLESNGADDADDGSKCVTLVTVPPIFLDTA